MNPKDISPALKKIIPSVIVLLIAAVFGTNMLTGDKSSAKKSGVQGTTGKASVVQSTEKKTEKEDFVGYTFRSSKQLTEHFKKHGKEVGARNESEYVDMANAVINSPSAMRKTEAEDGDMVYFLKSTGEIVFLSTDGFIRTYFIADEAYFNRT